jgi:osmotically-inducible protein OsmY
MTHDDDHCTRIMRALEESREIDSVDLRVAVDAGKVTVSGEVGSMAERFAVRSIVLSDPLSVDVTDELWASPLPGEWRLSDGEITRLVAARLAEHPGLAGVLPTSDFHVVQLDGVVDDPADRRIAHHLARTTRGVHFVFDRIQVTPARTAVAQAAR